MIEDVVMKLAVTLQTLQAMSLDGNTARMFYAFVFSERRPLVHWQVKLL